ncbi:MAG TPA: hypothetical protein DCF89_08655 [Flavobacteriales bacterium]|nr:hypothetical protein [Crocinitomicaceae bacterium]HAE31172.1 hypothetical protein [Flavobacteriales bacterium]
MLRKVYATFIIFLLSATCAFAQTGKIKGKVLDRETGEGIPFATIKVYKDGLLKSGTETDMEGQYLISSLDAASYDLEVEGFGYMTQRLQGVIVNDGKIQFADFKLKTGDGQTGEMLDEVEVIYYEVPLIDKDGGASGGTVTREDIAKMPGRSAASIAATVGGVGQDANGNISSVRGARNNSTYYYIDGIKVRGSTGLPKAAIQEVQVITGGLPANYGDATGGVISITTRGPSSFYFGGIDYLTSGFKLGENTYGLDNFGYNLLEGSLSGPLIMKKDSNGEKTEPIVGFFISANATSIVDDRPFAIPTVRLKPSVKDELIANPLRPTGTGQGVFYNTDFLTANDFEEVKYRQNIARQGVTFSGKLDINAGPTVNLTFGGSLDWNTRSSGDWFNSVFNYDNFPKVTNLTWRAFGRFSQRFTSERDEDDPEAKQALIKNIYYTVSADFSKFNNWVEDYTHGDNLFNYGYVGKFETYRRNSYQWNNELQSLEHNGFDDYLVEFTPSETNTELAAITSQYYSIYDDPIDNYENFTQILDGNALLNGMLPSNVYGIWGNIGTQYNGYQRTDNQQFRVVAMGSADIGNHAVSIGFEYEQRQDRFFSASPVALWTHLRQLTNNHIIELDYSKPTITNIGSITQIDYARLNAAPGEYVGSDAQAFFDYNLRNALGMDPDGTEFINVDAIDPEFYAANGGLGLFSADELLNNGNNFVTYYGYDHTGQKTTTKPSFDDFFTEQDEYGNFTRPVAPFEPIYTAAYIMDKFAFDDLIFNVGLRVDRFDANQMVLSDPFSLYPTKTVKEVSEFNHPSSISQDAVVYVNDIYNPTSVNGYREGSNWFNADGTPITDPSLIYTAAGVAPYLADGVSPDDEVSSNAFVDYEPQINVMPRIAFSFPISDEALFFAHYDVLTVRPNFGNRLDPLDYFYMKNRNVTVNNPNLRPSKTIDYELGFQQVLSSSSSLKIQAFYRELRDQIAVVAVTGAYPRTYTSYGNIDFGTVKGLTVMYDLRRTGNLWMRAAYTLQFAEGTGSDAQSALNLVNTGQPNLRTIFPFNYDQRHAINATVDYRFGEGSDYNGPIWFGKQVLKNTGANFVANLASGTPYSGQSNITASALGTNGQLEGNPNGARKPWQFRVDAQFDKNITLKFGKSDEGEAKKVANLNIYLLITNLFNTRNIVSVYRATGNPDDDGYLNAAQFQNTIELQNSQETYRYLYALRANNPFNYSVPRTIRLGIKLDF